MSDEKTYRDNLIETLIKEVKELRKFGSELLDTMMITEEEKSKMERKQNRPIHELTMFYRNLEGILADYDKVKDDLKRYYQMHEDVRMKVRELASDLKMDIVPNDQGTLGHNMIKEMESIRKRLEVLTKEVKKEVWIKAEIRDAINDID